MNLALGLVCCVAVVLLDGVRGLSEELFSDDEIVDSNEVNLPHKNPLVRRRGKTLCRRKLSGRCVQRRKPCPGRFPSQTSPGGPYCSKFHRCCHPEVATSCNTTDMIMIGSEYYKVFVDYDNPAYYTWDAVRQLCSDVGLVMAEPLDHTTASTLAMYTPLSFFLGARGNGTTFVWNSGTVLPSTSPLWQPGQPGSSVTTDYCLFTGNADYPYYADICTYISFAVCQCP